MTGAYGSEISSSSSSSSSSSMDLSVSDSWSGMGRGMSVSARISWTCSKTEMFGRCLDLFGYE